MIGSRRYVGLDVGGTTIKAGLCDDQGRLLAMLETPTRVEEGVDSVVQTMIRSAQEVTTQSGCQWESVQGIGIGMAGFLDIPRGIVRYSANFPGWIDVPLQTQIEAMTGKSVKVNNDANVATLGEVWSGAGKGIAHVVMFTLGTGIGGGVVVHHRLVEGVNGTAGELGHIPVINGPEAVQCGCGQWGCVETVASATGIVRLARVALERGARSALADHLVLTAKIVFEEAQRGDEVAKQIVQQAAQALATAMVSVAVILNPQRLIVGGGVSQAGEGLLVPLREAFYHKTPPAVSDRVDIVSAVLGNQAGMIGAAGLHVRG